MFHETNKLYFTQLSIFSCLELLNEDIGFKYGKSNILPDESLDTSTEQFNDIAPPYDGRLYKPGQFWCPIKAYKSSYLELVLVEKYYIFAVSIQGRALSTDPYFVMDIHLSYSEKYSNWRKYDTTFKVSYFFSVLISTSFYAIKLHLLRRGGSRNFRP